MEKERLYVLCRKDLSDKQQAVQSGHAVAEWLLHPESKGWSNGTLIYLGVKNKKMLVKIKDLLTNLGKHFVEFKEPYYNNSVTAIATAEPVDVFQELELL